MQWYEILIIALAAVFVIGVCVWQVVRKKKGKVGCDCCSECSHCSHCKTKRANGSDESKKSE